MVIRQRRLDDVFQSLADPTRREMLALLARGEATAGELGAPFRISQPAASRHIRVLERAGLVRRRVDGREHRLRLVPQRLRDAEGWIARHRRFWEASLDSLGHTLDELTREDQT
jgi:DNA-binding transcriptional ArsR family regulator